MLDLDLEPDEIEVTGHQRNELAARTNVIYKKIVEKVAMAKEARQNEQEKKDQQKKELVDLLVQETPQQYVTEAIDQRVDQRLVHVLSPRAKPTYSR